MDALRWNVLLKWMKALGHPWQRIMAAQEGSVPEDATVSCRHPRRLGDIRGILYYSTSNYIIYILLHNIIF